MSWILFTNKGVISVCGHPGLFLRSEGDDGLGNPLDRKEEMLKTTRKNRKGTTI